jgi:uncharacterized protein (TIGR03032 family)
MNETLPPFSCTNTPEIPALLANLNCSLAISTYQAGKVILLSAPTGARLIQLPRTFRKPMGMAVAGQRMAVATLEEVVVLANAPYLASAYPRKPNTYDALYTPRAIYYTGVLDLHDMQWGTDGLWAVNTRFSCLSLIDDAFSFTPRWQPPFITELVPNDLCHLNGLALVDGQPRYVTALGATTTEKGWRHNKLEGGILMEVPGGEVLLSGLPMPHSPRLYDGKLYLLLSATGELVCADLERGSYETVVKLPGFARGMSRYGDYLFIGISRMREQKVFADLPVGHLKPFAGIVVVHLPSGQTVGHIEYLTSCQEIYDVQVLEGIRRPGILGFDNNQYRLALSLPGGGFWGEEAEDDGESQDQEARHPSHHNNQSTAQTQTEP